MIYKEWKSCVVIGRETLLCDCQCYWVKFILLFIGFISILSSQSPLLRARLLFVGRLIEGVLLSLCRRGYYC